MDFKYVKVRNYIRLGEWYEPMPVVNIESDGSFSNLSLSDFSQDKIKAHETYSTAYHAYEELFTDNEHQNIQDVSGAFRNLRDAWNDLSANYIYEQDLSVTALQHSAQVFEVNAEVPPSTSADGVTTTIDDLNDMFPNPNVFNQYLDLTYAKKIRLMRSINYSTTMTQIIKITASENSSVDDIERSFEILVNEIQLQWQNSLGHALVESVDFQIGEQRIDRIVGEWLDIRDQLTVKKCKQIASDTLVGRHHILSDGSGVVGVLDTTSNNTLTVELPFWFTQSLGQALPVIAMHHEECKVNIKLRSLHECVQEYTAEKNLLYMDPNAGDNLKATLWIDYVYLETSERVKLAKEKHEFLISQVQYMGAEAITLPDKNHTSEVTKFLKISHPVKELIWAFRRPDAGLFQYNETEANSINEIMCQEDTLNKCRLRINGLDRFPEREGKYFRLIQPMQHHTAVPTKNIYCYSFALHPEKEHPSGTLNFSRIDRAHFILTLNGTSKTIKTCDYLLFAVNYNVLRIQSGLSGLLFSN